MAVIRGFGCRVFSLKVNINEGRTSAAIAANPQSCFLAVENGHRWRPKVGFSLRVPV
jgi:hypothetical protein